MGWGNLSPGRWTGLIGIPLLPICLVGVPQMFGVITAAMLPTVFGRDKPWCEKRLTGPHAGGAWRHGRGRFSLQGQCKTSGLHAGLVS